MKGQEYKDQQGLSKVESAVYYLIQIVDKLEKHRKNDILITVA